MGWRIVKQPNGRYARWSDVVDNFTDINMSRSEALEVCRQQPGMGTREAEAQVGKADRDEIAGKLSSGSGLDRWNEALDDLKALDKADACEEVIQLDASMPRQKFTAEFFAKLEGDAVPFAAAPRLLTTLGAPWLPTATAEQIFCTHQRMRSDRRGMEEVQVEAIVENYDRDYAVAYATGQPLPKQLPLGMHPLT